MASMLWFGFTKENTDDDTSTFICSVWSIASPLGLTCPLGAAEVSRGPTFLGTLG